MSGKIFLLRKDVKTFRSRPLILKEILIFINLKNIYRTTIKNDH